GAGTAAIRRPIRRRAGLMNDALLTARPRAGLWRAAVASAGWLRWTGLLSKIWSVWRRRVPVKLQMEVTECGAACLAMLLSYHGRETSIAECRAWCGGGRDGITARVIVEAARRF